MQKGIFCYLHILNFLVSFAYYLRVLQPCLYFFFLFKTLLICVLLFFFFKPANSIIFFSLSLFSYFFQEIFDFNFFSAKLPLFSASLYARWIPYTSPSCLSKYTYYLSIEAPTYGTYLRTYTYLRTRACV